MNRILILALAALPFAAQAAVTVSGPVTATANLINLKNQPIGTATLTQMPNGVQIRIDATNLPSGNLAFHIHETGTCDASTGFKSAGGHFNPMHKEHGTLDPNGAHAGDMMNLTVDNDGTIHTDVINPNVSLTNGLTGLLDADGSALVIHAKPDDYKSQPAGAAGDRIACGVINPANK